MIETCHGGDIFDSEAEVLVNAVNCVGVMGAGLAAEFKARYPQMFKSYETACKAGFVRPGQCHLYLDAPQSIVNFPTKDDWRHPSRLEWIESGLKDLYEILTGIRSYSVAIPMLGCGYGGLHWDDVGPLIWRQFETDPNIKAIVYVR